MMRTKGILTAGLLFCLAGSALGTAAIAAAPDPSGVWLRDDGNARVRIAACGADLCATNLWIKDTSNGEEVGDKLVMTLTPGADNTLAGKAFDAKRDKTFSMTLTVKDDQLRTRGCILGQLICKDVNWTAVR